MRKVKDHKYGNENPNVTGGWDGIIGELVRRVSLEFNFNYVVEIVVSFWGWERDGGVLVQCRVFVAGTFSVRPPQKKFLYIDYIKKQNAS